MPAQALALNPFALGTGIDADTAAIIGPDNAGGQRPRRRDRVVDPSDVGRRTSPAGAQAPISITNRLHVLVHGTRYDLDFRRPL